MGNQYANLVFDMPSAQEFTYRIPSTWNVTEGVRLRVPFGKGYRLGVVLSIKDQLAEKPAYTIKAAEELIDRDGSLFTDELFQFATWLAKTYYISLGTALFTIIPPVYRGRSGLAPEKEPLAIAGHLLNLSDEQRRALSGILAARQDLFYLYGITGSGKTEVFIQLAQKILDQGLSVIYLVPEIALSYHLVKVINDRFPQESYILHSGLTAKQRSQNWQAIKASKACIVLGARSAVFAPVRQLGMIIMDEEHENSYKSAKAPRYHTRQLALYRCRYHQAKLVMGSATPSLESWALIKQGRSMCFSLTKRLAGGHSPTITLVQLRDGLITDELYHALQSTLQAGKQAVLFLNRRGFSYSFICGTCGYIFECPHCSVSLTYHKRVDLMLCHYCGYTCKPVSSCPQCRSLDMRYCGFGIQQVEEELRRLFPSGLGLARVDSDAISSSKKLETILKKFQQGDINVLLGTQMIAKGLDVPNVQLAGIILADAMLNMPDFRAAERCFSQLIQVAGRAGRHHRDGRVIVQAFFPQHPVILQAVSMEVEDFYAKELAVRKQGGFPPFARMVRLVLRSRNTQQCVQASKELGNFLSRQAKDMIIHQPQPCVITKISGRVRYQIILMSRDLSYRSLHRLLNQLRDYHLPRGIHLEIDVDPQNML